MPAWEYCIENPLYACVDQHSYYTLCECSIDVVHKRGRQVYGQILY